MTTRQDAMDRAGETGEVVFGREGKCSDERPCLPCYLDQGRCQAAPVAVAPSDAERILAGLLFSFGGFLTTHKTRWKFSSYDEAGPMVSAIEEFAAKFALSLDEADVSGWRDATDKLSALPIDFKQATDQGGLTVAARDVLAARQRQISAEGWTPEPSLKERADALMAAGHAFWQACRRDAGGGAVRWLKATDGTTIIFTRGEYAGTLLSAIGTDYQAPEIVFEQPVGDDDMGGIVASIAAADTQ